MNIDVDSHFTPYEIFDNIPSKLKDAPRWSTDSNGRRYLRCGHVDKKLHYARASTNSVKMRLEAMKEGGFDKQCLNVALNTIPTAYLTPETELYLTRAWNDAVSRITEKHDCFIGVAQIPHHDPNAAIEEAERAVRTLGFRAIEMHGNWAGENIESQKWWPFFEALEKLGVPLVSHPAANVSESTFNPYMPAHENLELMLPEVSQLFSFVVLHQISMVGLVCSGLLDKFPLVKVLWLETDVGWLPGFMDLIDAYYDVHQIAKRAGTLPYFRCKSPVESVTLRKRPSQYFRDNFYYSISVPSDLQLKLLLPLLLDKLGFDRNLTIQSDYDHTEGTIDIARRIRTLSEIDEEAKERICGRNAADLLKIKWAPSMQTWD